MTKPLLAVLFLLSVIGCETGKEQQDRLDRAQTDLQTTIANQQSALDAQLLEAEVRLITLRHGELAGKTYELCHTIPPTTKAHKLECERLDKQKARDDARDAAHPW